MKTARTLRASQRARALFLTELAARGNITDACAVAQIGRRTVYEWKAADPAFAADWDTAVNTAVDSAEREAWRRAIEGIDKPLIGRVGKDQDGVVTVIKEYSDAILLRILSAHRPEKWREKSQIEHTGEVVKVYAGFDPDKV